MLFSKDKKGSMILVAVYEILAVLAIIFILVSVADVLGNSDTVFKINAVEDIRMMINTLVGVTGDAVVEYPNDVSEYIFILSQNKILMFKEDERDQKIERMFFVPEGYSAQGVTEEVEKICLEKRDKTILLRPCE